MKIINQCLLRSLVVYGAALWLLSGCGSIKIAVPENDDDYVVNPPTVKVSHSSCVVPRSESFRALLDEGTDNEVSLTGFFRYSGSRRSWDLNGTDLPLGRHRLTVRADLSRVSGLGGLFCLGVDETDARLLIAKAPTCVRGTASATHASLPPLPLESTITVRRPATNQLLANVNTDSLGNFCIDRLPAGSSLKLSIIGARPDDTSLNCSLGNYQFNTPPSGGTRCELQTCADLGELEAYCAPD